MIFLGLRTEEKILLQSTTQRKNGKKVQHQSWMEREKDSGVDSRIYELERMFFLPLWAEMVVPEEK